MKRLYTLVIVAVIFSGWFNVASAQVIYMPDANLAAAIREALDLAPDASITAGDLRRLTTLDAVGRQITDLTGLQYARQLEELDLSDNQINDIRPVGDLSELTHLKLSGNEISDVRPLSRLRRLETLWLSDNEISEIWPLRVLRQLKTLGLDFNEISNIRPLAALRRLEQLYLWDNQISDVTPLASLRNLKDLDLDENQIRDVGPLSALTQLDHLWLRHNDIREIRPLSALNQLKLLNLGSNQISSVNSLASLSALKLLSLRNNQISDVSPLTGLTQLEELYLNLNQIIDVGPLSALTHLDGLSLNGNQIIDVGPLSDLTQLTRLWLHNNQIRDVSPLTNLVNLIVLSLAGNPISDISPLQVLAHQVQSLQTDIDIRIDEPVNVLIYTGFASWMELPDAIAEAETTQDLLQSAGIDAEITESEYYVRQWMLQTASDGAVDVLIVYGVLPGAIYAPKNTTPDESIAENWIETTDGNTILNHADYLGYWITGYNTRNEWGPLPNGFGTLQNLIDIPNIVIPWESVNANSPMSVTTDGSTLTPSLANFESDRAFPLDQLEGDWYPEKILASDTGDTHGTLADPVLLRDGDLGRIAIVYQTWFEDNPKGKVAAELIINYLLAEPVILSADINEDGRMNIQDLVFVASNLGETGENAADVNGDGIVDVRDLIEVAGAFDTPAAAPSLDPQALSLFTAADVRKWLSEAQHLNLIDPTSQRGIRFLEQLLTTLAPQETALLPNYPNPFNPETWIPYKLAKPADVTLTIYTANGRIVRWLPLGHQSAGMYQSRDRAVYWDGRNADGEPVASGIYFYTLTAGDFTATRKMLIRK